MTEKKILIFGGTTEGRKLTEYLAARKVRVHVCVATAYGESLLPESESVTAESSRMDVSEMCHRIREYEPAFVVDATHPYAREVSRNIKQACESCGKPYLRLLREAGTFLPEHDMAKDGTAAGPDGRTVWVESAKEAAEYLADKEGKILLTTGSKELEAFTRIPDYRERVYARVLSLPSVVEKCHGLGLEGRHLICMQGPFSAELNLAMLREFQIRFLVTKEAGSTGGFPEKREAAEKAGAVLVVIGRPEEREGFLEEELYAYLKQELSLSDSWELAIVGIGMGAEESSDAGSEKGLPGSRAFDWRQTDARSCGNRRTGHGRSLSAGRHSGGGEAPSFNPEGGGGAVRRSGLLQRGEKTFGSASGRAGLPGTGGTGNFFRLLFLREASHQLGGCGSSKPSWTGRQPDLGGGVA